MNIFGKFYFYFFISYVCFMGTESRSKFIRGVRFNYSTTANVTPNYQSISGISTKWFIQNLDHFNDKITSTWKQRYYVNTNFYKRGAPIFLMIGGEGPASIQWMSKGHWIELAEKYNALCFQLEHRYYGESHPTINLSDDNLQWLNSEQALADLANFIQAMNQEYNFNSPRWVTFGGSYPGSLSAWARLKYPHLIHTAVSSSGPLLAQLNFKEYFSVVTDAITDSSKQCIHDIGVAINSLVNYIEKGDKQKIEMIDKTFNLCSPLDIKNNLDIEMFFLTITSVFADTVQYNNDNRNPNALNIDKICQYMTNSSLGDPVQRLARLQSQTDQGLCLDYTYKSFIQSLNETSWNKSSIPGGRQWTYQTCTEFGFFQTSDLKGQPFSKYFPLSLYLHQCNDIFGENYVKYLAKGIDWTNTFYGAKNISTSRVIFVNGSVDPWHKLGLTEGPHGDNVVIFIKGTAHCANMYPSSSKDSQNLIKARKQIDAALAKWIQ